MDSLAQRCTTVLESTEARAGLAARLLAKHEVRTLAIIGPGVVGKICLASYMKMFVSIDKIYLKGSTVHSKTARRMKKFIEANYPQVKQVVICATLKEAVENADIVSESASIKMKEYPRYKKEWFKPGVLIISSGTFYMERAELLDITKVLDNYEMYEEYAQEDESFIRKDKKGRHEATGCLGEDLVYMMQEGVLKRESVLSLGEIILGKCRGRTSEDELIVVALGGLALEIVLA
ncbi:MAG: hypothetical protein PHN80_09100 [Hespellia sp.]|nr:hypothetical protein [Hespellia sp.]